MTKQFHKIETSQVRWDDTKAIIIQRAAKNKNWKMKERERERLSESCFFFYLGKSFLLYYNVNATESP